MKMRLLLLSLCLSVSAAWGTDAPSFDKEPPRYKVWDPSSNTLPDLDGRFNPFFEYKMD